MYACANGCLAVLRCTLLTNTQSSILYPCPTYLHGRRLYLDFFYNAPITSTLAYNLAAAMYNRRELKEMADADMSRKGHQMREKSRVAMVQRNRWHLLFSEAPFVSPFPSLPPSLPLSLPLVRFSFFVLCFSSRPASLSAHVLHG